MRCQRVKLAREIRLRGESLPISPTVDSYSIHAKTGGVARLLGEGEARAVNLSRFTSPGCSNVGDVAPRLALRTSIGPAQTGS